MNKKAFTGEITERDIDRWKKDFRRMTKIYRSIPRVTSSYDDPRGYERAQEVAKEARALWRTFKDRFEAWGFRVVLPKVKRDDESWLEGELRSAISEVVHRIRTHELFPQIYSSDGSFQADPDVNLGELVRRRDSKIKSFQRPLVKLFKLLDDYIQSSGGALERRAPVETYQVAGTTVVVDTYGMRDYGTEDLDRFLQDLRNTGFKPIQRAGFAKALEGLTLHVSFDRSDLVAGQYETAKDTIKIFPLGFSSGKQRSTFIHEVGHRFYYRNLSSNARAHWEETIEGRVTKLEKADIKAFVDTFLRSRKWPPTRRELESEVQQAGHDPETEAKYLKLADRLPGFTVDPDEIEAWWLDNLVGERVQLEEITEYGTTNPVEAFAEAFTEWVQKGPRALNPWTQNFFRVISRSGGAKLAHRVAARWRSRWAT